MLHGATLRSPHPHANILVHRTPRGREMAGVCAVLTHEDVPGRKVYGMEIPDQPVLAWEKVRYQGEPVAVVAADHPETARRALEKIRVEYEVLDPVSERRGGDGRGRAAAPPLGQRAPAASTIRHGDVAGADARADVVVAGEYEVGMQDQAFLGPESGPRGARRARAAWTSTSRPSGCTSTGIRSPRVAGPRARGRSGSPSPAWAAPSGGGRTSRCRSTPACSPSRRDAR